MIELEIEGLEEFEEEYSATDFLNDGKIKVKEEFENPYG